MLQLCVPLNANLLVHNRPHFDCSRSVGHVLENDLQYDYYLQVVGACGRGPAQHPGFRPDPDSILPGVIRLDRIPHIFTVVRHRLAQHCCWLGRRDQLWGIHQSC